MTYTVAPRVNKTSSPDDLRAAGWTVAVHNDYRLNGEPHTFWLMTRGDECRKGEGKTDAEALNQIRAVLAATNPEPAAPVLTALKRMLPIFEKAIGDLCFTADKAGEVIADMNTLRSATNPEPASEPKEANNG